MVTSRTQNFVNKTLDLILEVSVTFKLYKKFYIRTFN